ncbi:helix-turn-helix transcriptional regulator [Nonomuraea sp. NPDC004354]
MLRGRAAEVAALERALSRAREGRGGAVVIRGEAGAGKTTLLESVSSSAGESRLLWAWGVESEAELPYAGLQVLFREVRHLADRLPEQQARALRGLIDPPYGAAGDRFLVGAAALTLLGELAEEQPVVVLIDDAHWLDLESAEALLFAARRLGAERVAMIFAVRDGSPVFDRPGVPVVELGPLSDEAGAALLADHAPDLHVSARQGLLSQAQGNPLALVELVGALSPAQRDGIEPVDEHEIGVMPVSWRIQRIFDARIGALPAPARTLLTIAAADDTGDPALIVRAGQRMGASVADLGPAADAGLIRVAEGRLRFRHPLARAAAYQSAPLSQRMAAHHALAETVGDGGRRAWHLAAATVGHDEQAATELERNAELFRSRGGLAAVAAAYRRAAQLTEDRDTRGRRLAAAAMAASEAGQIEHAAALAGEALPYVRDPAWIARLALTRARLEHARGRPESARTLLLDAATNVAPLDRQAGALMTFEAMAAAWDSPAPEAAAGDTAARLSGLDVPDAFLLRGADGLRLLATGDIASGAAELSADPAAKVRRLTAGATAALDAGLWQQAEGLARRADRPQDEEVAAELARVRATLAFQAGRPLEATRLLQEGAELIAAADPVSALTMLGLASVYVWSSRTHPDQVPLARRTEELTPRLDGPLGAVHALNHGMRRLLEGDLMAAITGPGLRSEESVPVDLRLLAAYRGFMRGDQHAMLQDATRLVAECRTAGRAGRLPQAMMLLALAQLTNGRHHAARESAADGIHIAEDVGQPYWHDYLTGLAAWLAGVAGEEERCRELAARADDVDGAWMTGLGWGTYALIALDLAAGRHTAVLERMDQALAGPARHAFLWWYACPDYVESAARAGTPERARPAFTRFRDWANVIDQPWAHAVLKRCEALLSGDGDGYARALALHRQADQPFEQARTELLYGEWLRRHQRRAEARTHLRAAMEGFERLGAAPWAKRAATELRAAGASLSDRRHAEDPLAALTPQELQVVRLAATGASNREIGAHLFLSPRTVAYHLYKAFPKLGITSRGELAQYVTVI